MLQSLFFPQKKLALDIAKALSLLLPTEKNPNPYTRGTDAATSRGSLASTLRALSSKGLQSGRLNKKNEAHLRIIMNALIQILPSAEMLKKIKLQHPDPNNPLFGKRAHATPYGQELQNAALSDYDHAVVFLSQLLQNDLGALLVMMGGSGDVGVKHVIEMAAECVADSKKNNPLQHQFLRSVLANGLKYDVPMAPNLGSSCFPEKEQAATAPASPLLTQLHKKHHTAAEEIAELFDNKIPQKR